ncbi:helix-turn-helix domain-containing protein [Umezawaea endophytica]|uniref:Helix-turn-helix domain-containing protein n=1 Tax=Umezawaea endophytica TaxID=1654476 RepID=A0A9X3A4X5_9PSEU|nr:helix-turn-helix transcriptional regulator [Umezawaea endophytica]MCS7483254.1 helix-turn-helix domain-containing protein [Umezawaea endophytica]
MNDFQATMLERAIGRTLRKWRRSRDLSLVEAGSLLRCSNAKISMMENAVRPVNPTDVMAAGFAYQVGGPERDKLYGDAVWAKQHRALAAVEESLLFDAARDYVELEFEASLLRILGASLLPGLLQIPDYTKAAIIADDPLRAEVVAEQQTVLRSARQGRLGGRDPLRVEAVFTEGLLNYVVGGPAVMRAQLLYLMELSERPNVEIQVVPFRAGAYPAMGSTFTVLSFPHEQHVDVVYVENFMQGQYMEHPRDRELCNLKFAALRRVALSPGESVELIAETVERL